MMIQKSLPRLFLLLLALLPLSAEAQQITWSEVEKEPFSSLFLDVLGKADNGLYVLKRNYREPNRNIYLSRYNEELRSMKQVHLLENQDEYLLDLIIMPQGPQLYYAKYDRDDKEVKIRFRGLDHNLEPLLEDTMVVSVPRERYASRYAGVFTLQNSPYVLLVYPAGDGEIPPAIAYQILDAQGQAITKGSVDVNLENEYSVMSAAYVEGKLALYVEEEVKRKLNRTDLHYHLLYGRSSSRSFEKLSLTGDSMRMGSGMFQADTLNRRLLFAGLYSIADSSELKGYYFWTFDSTGRAEGSQYPFSQTLIDEMEGKTSKSQSIAGLQLRNLVLRQDGGILLTAEEYTISKEMVSDMGLYGIPQSNMRYYYYYNDLLVLSIGPDGEADWHRVLRKDQVTVNDNGVYSSFEEMVLPGRLYYIYNDLSRKDWNLSLYEVDPKGISQNRILLRSREVDGRLVTKDAKQVSYNELVIPLYNRKGHGLVKITF